MLHLRPGWLEDEVDGLDAAGFAAEVGTAVGVPGPGRTVGVPGLGAAVGVPGPGAAVGVPGSGAAESGSLLVRVPGAAEPDGTPADPAPASGGNTMMLDLARVLDLYRAAREARPDATAGTLLREIVPELITAGGPGVTWAKPPTPAELRAVLGGSAEPRLT
ncbi:hypothetical protein ACFQYP_11435 [Nonomuraea antimicrobica]